MAVNVRVVARELGARAGQSDRDREFKKMLSIFRKAVTDSDVITLYKQKQFFESQGEKRRRKMKESVANRRREKGNPNG
jgi:ribosomal protein S21